MKNIINKLFSKSEIELGSPAIGEVVPVTQVSDPTFGEEILGKGIAMIPAEGKIYAPCNAQVDLMFDTGHAVSLKADNGAEILIHIGLETVNLKGKYYTVHVKTGDCVTKGQLLIEFDLNAIVAEGYDIITPMVICNSGEYKTINAYTSNSVKVGDKVIGLIKE